jgi:thiol-disulfide isomerase/thioredoxin
MERSGSSVTGGAAAGRTTYRTLRDQVIRIKGRTYDCWVVETEIVGETVSMPELGLPDTTESGTITSWIDKNLMLEVQSMGVMTAKSAGRSPVKVNVKTVTESLTVNEPVPDSVFTFTPPAGASEVEPQVFWASIAGKTPQTTLTGKDAPPFEVIGVDGKSYSLAQFKGKQVLLDFWATWCGPCQASMPILDDFYQKNNSRGVTVLGVDVAEEADVVMEFAKKKGIHYPIVLSGESGIIDAYQVTVYPTLVFIGADGKIKAYEMGFGGRSSFRQTLVDVGFVPPAGKQ